MSVAAALTAAALSWFGPVQVSFETALPGNPYDFHANDVRVQFVAPDGHREERLAYFEDGHWKSWLVATHPAEYSATLTHNGKPVDTAPIRVTIPETARLSGGFVRVQGTRFITDDGAPYFPLGHNLGWQQPDSPALLMQLRDMGAAQMNWTRIWACAFDEKNPFFSRTAALPPPGELLPAALRQWDGLVAAAEVAGVRLQLVLFHHGLFSTEVNPNWDEHAWNAANGGWLARPQDFFTDPLAREHTQRWLRYAVARWGHSPAIMAWELFNEVEWVDLVRKDHDWPTVAAWHTDMAAFLRSIDPYHHLITTSSALEHPALYDAMDFAQPHIYTRNLTVAIAGIPPLPGKPWFFGEFGGSTSGAAAANEKSLVRDGLWASILAGHAGGAGYWYWERVAQQRFSSEFTRAARGLEVSGLTAHPDAKSITVNISGTKPAPLVFTAGRGWGTTETHTFHLPADLTPQKLAGLSSYLRGFDPKKPDIPRPAPLELHFTAPTDDEATIILAGVGAKGSGLQVLLDGREVFGQTWSPTEATTAGPAPARTIGLPTIKVSYATGAHVLQLASTGLDWVQFGSITILGLGQTTHAMAIGDASLAMARITSVPESLPAKLDFTFPGLMDGDYRLTLLNLDTGAESTRAVTINNSTLRAWEVAARDVVLMLTR